MMYEKKEWKRVENLKTGEQRVESSGCAVTGARESSDRHNIHHRASS
jgi:hypothetical protein